MLNWARVGMATCVILAVMSAGCSRSPEERRKDFISIGDKRMAEKDWARAILEYKNAAQAVPGDPEAYYKLGLAYLATGDGRHGVGFLQKAVQINPKYGEAQLKLSELMILSDDHAVLEDAEDRLNNLLASSPNDAHAITALALAEWKLDQPQNAEKHLLEALDKMPGNLQASVSLAKLRIQQKDFAAAEKVLQAAAAQQPPAAAPFLALGEFYVSQNRVPDAAQQFRRALEIDPKNVEGLTQLAATEMGADHWDGAELIYRQVAALPDPQYRSLHALFLLQSGKTDQALAEFQDLYKKHPEDRPARTGLVAAYVATNRTKEAEDILNAALAKTPKDTSALLQRAGLRVSASNWDAAEADLRLVIQADTASPQAHFLMARVYGGRQDIQRRIQELNESLRLEPAFLAARLELARVYTSSNTAKSNTAKLALDILKQAPETQRNTAAVIAEANWARFALGQQTEVEATLKDALAQSKLPDLMLQNAVVLIDHGKQEEARKQLREVLSSQPEDIRALQLLAWSYQTEKRIAQGLDELRKFADQHPNSSLIQQFVGSALLSQGNKEDARSAFTRAKSADPAAATPYLYLAQMDATSGQLDSSKATLQALVKQQSKNVTANLWLGNIAILKGDYPTAIQEYQQVLAIEPSNVSALNNLAYLLAEHSQKPDEALQYAQKARALAPTSGSVANTLGRVYYLKGLYTQAIPLLKSAVDIDGGAQNNFHLGFAYLKAGEAAKGRQTLTAALKMDPRLPEAEEAKQLLSQSSKQN
jgi:tetratricopeptide (TPR) repeat protein